MGRAIWDTRRAFCAGRSLAEASQREQSVRVAATEETGHRLAIDPTLRDAIAVLSKGGYWAIALDDHWRFVAMTDEMAAVAGGRELDLGAFHFGPEAIDRLLGGSAGLNSIEENRELLRHVGGWMLSDIAGGPEAIRPMLHPALRDVVDELEPCDAAAMYWDCPMVYFGDKIGLDCVAQRVRDATGHVVGTVIITKPAVGMITVAMLTASSDLEHLHRMQQFGVAGRRPAAVLSADLEGSAQLSKQLPTASYFTLIRRITRAADQCVIDAGGLVGRHVGDGVTAFFVAEAAESESAAAGACIAAVRALQAATLRIAARHELPPENVTIRAGLHWGATPYIGSIITAGRTEVTALGDEVNEAARIEACATGGRILASKNLIERLDPDDATALGIDPNRVTYTQLADLDTATDKARRDAPAIPVCDIASPAT
jgi:class 3 adenylate cyclase